MTEYKRNDEGKEKYTKEDALLTEKQLGENMEGKMDKDYINESSVKIAAFIGIIAIAYGIHFFAPEFFNKIVLMSTKGDINGTVAYLRSFGHWAIVISFFLDVFINAVGCLPSIFLSTANGVIFGLPIGVTVSWVAESVGVIISFVLMRYFLRGTAEMIIEKSNNLKKLDEMSGEKGLTAMALARTLPYFPSGILTALGAISKMKFRDYAIATFIGKFPSTTLEVVLGHDIVNFRANMHRLAILVTLVCIIYGLLFWRQRQKQKKEEAAEKLAAEKAKGAVKLEDALKDEKISLPLDKEKAAEVKREEYKE